jgi:hypothetical protein
MKCIFTLDDFCVTYQDCLQYLEYLNGYFDDFKASLFTIPCHNRDYLSDHKDWVKKLPEYLEFIPHGWIHNNHEFAELDYHECRDRINLGIMEFADAGIPLVRGFKAPNWRYNKNLVRALHEKGFWLAIYTEGNHAGKAEGVNLPTHLWNWDIGKPIPDKDPLYAHGHVHSQSGPGAYIGDSIENITKLPKDTKFVFLSEHMTEQMAKAEDPKEQRKPAAIEIKEEPKEGKRPTREEIVDRKATKWNEEISVLITAHMDQRVFLDACIDSVKDLGWVLMVYDNPDGDYQRRLPKDSVFKKLDQFFMKHPTRDMPGPTYPQFWNFRHGIDLLLGSKSKYIFVIGADSILERPEGLPEIMEMLGDGDMIACSTRNPQRHKDVYCNTKSLLATKSAFKTIIDHVQKGFVPMDYQFGNMESRFGLAIKETGIKEVKVPDLPGEDQFAYSYNEEGKVINNGTWGDVLGYRHLAGEHKIRRKKKIVPVEEEYFDKDYLRRYELDTMAKYWETGEEKHLKAWWED